MKARQLNRARSKFVNVKNKFYGFWGRVAEDGILKLKSQPDMDRFICLKHNMLQFFAILPMDDTYLNERVRYRNALSDIAVVYIGDEVVCIPKNSFADLENLILIHLPKRLLQGGNDSLGENTVIMHFCLENGNSQRYVLTLDVDDDK